MHDLVRDSMVGQLVRSFSGNKYLLYPEERPDFQCPPRYLVTNPSPSNSASTKTEHWTKPHPRLEVQPDEPDVLVNNELSGINTSRSIDRAEAGAENYPLNFGETPESPTPDEHRILVDWYGPDDPENPKKWSRGRRAVVVGLIYIYGLAIYTGSSIITPAGPYIERQMDVSANTASLTLSMYVLGYGVGPLLFSPLSEIPVLGRNPPYIVSMGLFVILSIPTAIVNNLPGLVVLRFLQGFMGSPCLATGGATLGDIFTMAKLPYFLAGWAGFATTGPALGPIVSGFSVPAKNWHWSMWELLWFAAPVFIAMALLLPETSPSTILYRRALRLRKLTGNARIVSQSEIDQRNMTFREVVVENLWRPTQINMLDPAVLFTSIYSGLLYGVFYTFFEVFPLVYAVGIPGTSTHGYEMNAGELGLIFLANIVGVGFGFVCYCLYLHVVYEPEINKHGLGAPEKRLLPALPASLLFPVGLFIFAWTGYSSPNVHWIVPTIGVAITNLGSYVVFQCLLFYLPLNYPQYAASLFAANDFARSSVAAGAIHFSRPLFYNLGVARGVSLLAGLTFGGILGIFALWYYGAALRARSKFTAK